MVKFSQGNLLKVPQIIKIPEWVSGLNTPLMKQKVFRIFCVPPEKGLQNLSLVVVLFFSLSNYHYFFMILGPKFYLYDDCKMW